RIRCYVPLSFQSIGVPRSQHSFPTRRSSVLRHTMFRWAAVVIARPAVFHARVEMDFTAVFRVSVAVFPTSDAGGNDALPFSVARSEEHTSELQSRENIVCRLLPEKKK